jgi:hypothetical protein
MENDKQVPADPASNRSRLGVTALILSLIPLPMAGLYILVFYLFSVIDTGAIVLPDLFWLAFSYLPLCFSGLGVIFTLIALILSVMSLFRREPRKWPAILAIVLSLPGGVIMALMTFLVMVISRT